MMIYICIAIIVAVMLLILLISVLPVRIRMPVWAITALWMIFVLALAVLGYRAKPTYEYDLYRIYKEMEALAFGRKTILGSPMILENLLYFLIGKTGRYEIFPFLTVLIWGLCVAGIVQFYEKQRQRNCGVLYSKYPKMDSGAVMLYFLASLGGVFVIYLISGNRSGLVAAIWSITYYKYYHTRRWLYYCVNVPLVFFHLLAGILLGLVFLYSFINKRKSALSLFVTLFLVFVLGYILNINPRFLGIILPGNLSIAQAILEKIQQYSTRGLDEQIPVFLMLRFVGMGYLLLCVIYLHIKRITEYDLIGFFILVTFAGYQMSILSERMPYVLGVASLPILNEAVYRISLRGLYLRFLIIIPGVLIFLAQVLYGFRLLSLMEFA